MTNRTDHPFIHKIPVKDRNGNVVGEKEVVSYRGLLDLAHKDGLRKIRTKLIQTPSKANGEMAIVTALVRTNRGTFTGIGDACPGNVNSRVARHLIRMAETRAEARALRKAVNIGVIALEELGEDLTDGQTYDGAVQPAQEAAPSRPAATAASDMGASSPAPKPSEEQRRYLYRLLAEHGLQGEEAREHIHRELAVDSFHDATRSQVSALINRLKTTPRPATTTPAAVSLNGTTTHANGATS